MWMKTYFPVLHIVSYDSCVAQLTKNRIGKTCTKSVVAHEL
jgi:hypothetical protein